MTIVDLYRALAADPRLQKDWEANQPRVDRAFEAPLIARTPREVATAALLWIKLRFEPTAAEFNDVLLDEQLLVFARSQGPGGARLANVITNHTTASRTARAAAIHALAFYRCRSQASPLVRLAWSRDTIKAVAYASPDQLIDPALRPTWADRKAKAVACIASMLQHGARCDGSDKELRENLRSVPGLGPERADAVGVFAFRRPWPIVDHYLWSGLADHRVIGPTDARLASNDARCCAFAPYWAQLAAAFPEDLNNLAATLYLWSDEAARFGYRYTQGP
jgi:hypothetical protein